METLLSLLDYILFFYFLLSVLYLFRFALLAQKKSFPEKLSQEATHRFVILIPAYREDGVIEESVKETLALDYPTELVKIIVIADQMRAETLERLRSYPIDVLEMPEGPSSKARALTYATASLSGFDIALILDADNLLSREALRAVEKRFTEGYRAIQLHRKAKNLSPAFAYLDAVSEEINNTLFRKGPRADGLSAALSGSGMAFDFEWFKDRIARAQTAGEDKEIEWMLLQEEIEIDYLDAIPVLDEKVTKAAAFYGQRRRWIASQFDLLKRILPDLRSAVEHQNRSLVHKIIQQFLLPRLLLLGLLVIITGGTLLLAPDAGLKWGLVLLLFAVTLWISIPSSLRGTPLWRAALHIPTAFILLFANLFRIKGATGKFIHTAHGGEPSSTGLSQKDSKNATSLDGNRPLRIAVEAQRIFRSNPHGMDRVAIEMLRELQRIDSKNEYYVLVKPGTNHTLQESERLHIVEVKCPTYPLWEQIALARALRKIKPDIVHCTSNTAPLFPGVKKRVITLHDIIFLEPIHGKNPSLYQRFGNYYRRWIVPPVIKRCSRIITVSHTEAENIEKRLGYKDKLEVAYNGLDHALFRMNPNPETLQRLGLPERFILFFGNTDPKKNTPRVLRAYLHYREKSAAPLPLVVIDLSQEMLREGIGAEHLSLLSDRSIIPLGYVAHNDLPALFGGTFAFLYPSLRESFGLPILEAMACGTPVITSNVAAMPEIAGEGALLVDPYRKEEIANALLRLENEPGLWHQQQIYGLTRAQTFTWEACAKAVLGVYESIQKEGGI